MDRQGRGGRITDLAERAGKRTALVKLGVVMLFLVSDNQAAESFVEGNKPA
jgi:hypothetical protein